MKYLPYIFIALILFIAAGLYLNATRGSVMMGVHEIMPTRQNSGATLKNLGPAPEIAGISSWLNSDPVTIASLKGKVVLVDFWTYSCINCIRTLPYVTKWYNDYKDKGFVVLGIHTPEFAFEKDRNNVADALKRFGINYPVGQDNDYKTWSAYSNQYWPAKYLIDQKGDIVYTHFGEGDYDVTENAIRQLLGLDQAQNSQSSEDLTDIKTPEIYFGTQRLQYIANTKVLAGTQTLTMPENIPLNLFGLGGSWNLDKESATLTSGVGKIKLHFSSSKAFMVASSSPEQEISVSVDGQPSTTVKISSPILYQLFSGQAGEHSLEITIPKAGFKAFTFTFG